MAVYHRLFSIIMILILNIVFLIQHQSFSFAVQLNNGALSGTGERPEGWLSWGDNDHTSDSSIYHSPGNSWKFCFNAGLYQDLKSGFEKGDKFRFGGYLRHNSDDPLREGSKSGQIAVEFRDQSDKLIGAAISASPIINQHSKENEWIKAESEFEVNYDNVFAIRLLVRLDDELDGDGSFYADDLFIEKIHPKYLNIVPNPFAPLSNNPDYQKVKFELPVEFSYDHYQIKIYNINGKEMIRLDNQNEWDGKNSSGQLCEGGVYLIQAKTDKAIFTGKLMLIK